MKLIVKLFILSLLVFFPAFVLAEDFPSFPMAFWGTATIDGQPLPSGTKIKAFCGSNLIGEVTMLENGIYGYADSTKVKLLAGNCSGDILFKYLLAGATNPLTGGTEIKYTGGFEAGKVIPKNLNFITVRGDTSSGGGTPSGGILPTTIKPGDANNDGKVDIIDFNLLMVNWGDNPTNLAADLNGDGKVDIFDFNILMINWTI